MFLGGTNEALEPVDRMSFWWFCVPAVTRYPALIGQLLLRLAVWFRVIVHPTLGRPFVPVGPVYRRGRGEGRWATVCLLFSAGVSSACRVRVRG